MTIAARLLQGRKRIYSGQQGLFAAQPMSLRYSAAQKFSFVAPLRTSVFLERGFGAASFVRATVATVKDFEGNIKTCLANEVRFQNARRVGAYAGTAWHSETLVTGWTNISSGTVTVSVCPDAPPPECQTASRLTAGAINNPWWGVGTNTATGTRLMRASFWAKAVSGGTTLNMWVQGAQVPITITTEWVRYATAVFSYSGTGTPQFAFALAQNQVIDATGFLMEEITGQANQNPSEYVSVGATKLNELVQTEDFSLTWGKANLTVTSDAVAAPFGGLADKAVETAVNGVHEFTQAFTTLSTTDAYSLSVYAKAGERSWLALWLDGTAKGAYFDVANGVVGTTSAGVTAAIVPAGAPGWYRCSISVTPTAAASNFGIYLASADGTASYLGDITKGLYLWGAHFKKTAVLPDYFPVGNVYPFHGACVDGVKYFDYTNPNRVVNNVVYSDVPTEPCEGFGQAIVSVQAAGSGFSASGIAGSNFVGDVTVMCRYAPPLGSWGSSRQVLVSRRATATEAEFEMYMETDTSLRMIWYEGGVQKSAVSTALLSALPAGATYLRAVRQNNVAGVYNVKFYTSVDGVNWTQLGTTVVGAVAANPTATSNNLLVGNSATGYMSGTVLRAAVWSNATMTGAPVVDFNPRDGWTENRTGQSQDFTQSLWTGAAVGIAAFGAGSVSNATTAPDGTLTADLIVPSAAAGGHYEIQYSTALAVDGDHFVSVYVKAGGYNYFAIGANGTSSIIEANLATGTIVASSTPLCGIVPVGDGWYRVWCIATFNNQAPFFIIMATQSTPSYTGDGVSGVYMWGVQTRRVFAFGAPSLDRYVPTTSALRRGWYSSTGEFWDMNGMASLYKARRPRYLPEAARSNLVLQSSNFGTTWSGAGTTPTRVAGAAYCGDIALDLIGDDDAGVAELYAQNVTYTGDGTKTLSLLVKQGTSTSSLIRLRDTPNAADRLLAALTWANGVPALTFTTGSQERPPEAMGNGIWRVFCLCTGVVAASTNTVQLWPATTAAFAVANTGTVYMGGVHTDNALTASSLIPTTTGTVTKNVDSLKFPTAGNYSTAAGAAYVESVVGAAGATLMTGDIGGTPATIISRNPTNVAVYDGTNSCSRTGVPAQYYGAPKKIAMTWGAAGLAITEEGLAPATSAFDGTMEAAAGYLFVGVQSNGGNASMAETGPVMVAQNALSTAEIVALTA